jgi:purine nucleosidase
MRPAMPAAVSTPLLCLGVVALAASLAACGRGADQPGDGEPPAGGDTRIRVLLDTDANNELDDQHAIAYMLFNGHVFDVEGITVNRTRAGGDVTEHYAEAERVIRLADLDGRIPLYQGADGSFTGIRPHLDQPDYDGAEAVRFIIARAHADDARPLVLLPVGKLTNIALALAKDPSIAERVRIVWLGSNYPERGEYNKENDPESLTYILDDTNVPFEIVTVRYGKPSGTDAVRATPEEIRERMADRGPRVSPPVTGREGGSHETFGDYSIALFEHIELHGDPPSRALFDMAAVAIVKNPAWASSRRIPAPRLETEGWVDRPGHAREVVLWEHFDGAAIMNDFYATMEHYELAR